MLNSTTQRIEACLDHIQHGYHQAYPHLKPEYAALLTRAGRMVLAHLANTDAPYHNIDHTILVTLAGQDILWGKHLCAGGVSPLDWLHVMLSLLCHDIGYVRGVCWADHDGSYITGCAGHMVTLPPGATDASLTPYHVDRGKHFVRECFGGPGLIDAEVIAQNIERTRFPIPVDHAHQRTDDYPGLVRAADLIGQLADPNHDRRFPDLFAEFEETGTNLLLGCTSPQELRAAYPAFFWDVVHPYMRDGIRYLRATRHGQQWVDNLYANVKAIAHGHNSGKMTCFDCLAPTVLVAARESEASPARV
jgi:hypothetical protein